MRHGGEMNIKLNEQVSKLRYLSHPVHTPRYCSEEVDGEN